MTAPESHACTCGHNGLPAEWHADRCVQTGGTGAQRGHFERPNETTEAERKLRRVRRLAEQWATLTHWDYKGSPKVAEARAASANDAARILLNVLDGGDLL